MEYRVNANFFEKLFHFGFENRKNAGYLYEGLKISPDNPKQTSQTLEKCIKMWTQIFHHKLLRKASQSVSKNHKDRGVKLFSLKTVKNMLQKARKLY